MSILKPVAFDGSVGRFFTEEAGVYLPFLPLSGYAAFRLAQVGKDLRFTESAGLHQDLLVYKARENSTFEARYLPRGLPTTYDVYAVKLAVQRNVSSCD